MKAGAAIALLFAVVLLGGLVVEFDGIRTALLGVTTGAANAFANVIVLLLVLSGVLVVAGLVVAVLRR